jgi:hypothetical protein
MQQAARVEPVTVPLWAHPARRTLEMEAVAVAATTPTTAQLVDQAVPVSSSSVIRQER